MGGSRPLAWWRYAACVAHRADEPALESVVEPASADDQREVALTEDDLVILPDQTTDDTDAGWGEVGSANDDYLLAERPPHWG